jgi:NADH:ubiquinone oxidoreductase subunit 6 (subunit J)
MQIVIWAVVAICMAVTFAISYLGGLNFKQWWAKLLQAAVAVIIGYFTYILAAAIWIRYSPDQATAIKAAFARQSWAALGAAIVMAYFGGWRVPKIVQSKTKTGQ